jgi:hypothetical protein
VLTHGSCCKVSVSVADSTADWPADHGHTSLLLRQQQYSEGRQCHSPPIVNSGLQFGAQEPGDAAAISGFVADKYAVTFPLMAKVEVNGPQQHPVFAWLKANAPAAPGGGSLRCFVRLWGGACHQSKLVGI